MPLRAGSFCTLLLVVACATRTGPPAPKAENAPPADLHGTIVAMRPVPAETPGPALLVLSSLGSPAGGDNHVFEFIVRTASGTIISIVQQPASNLHPGEHVSILRSPETRIEAAARD